MAIRMSGLVSNLDTDSIIKELMSAQNKKKEKVQAKITKLEWKQEKWKELNTKIYALYTGTLTSMKTEGTYQAKKASSTNESKLSVTAGNGAVEGAHTVSVNSLASSQYLTGATIPQYTNADGEQVYATASTKLSDLGFDTSTAIRVQVEGKDAVDIAVDGSTTLSDFVNGLKEAGLNASYDSTYHKMFISSKDSGTANAFSITSGTVSSTAERDGIKTALDYSNLSTAKQKKADTLIANYRSAVIDGSTDKIEEAEKAIQDFASDNLKTKITNEAKEAYKASLAEGEEIDKEAQTAAVNAALEAAEGQFESLESSVSTAVAAYDAAVSAGDFSSSGSTALGALGLTDISYNVDATGNISYSYDESSSAVLVKASDAEITYNGASFKSSSNNISVNGLNFTANKVTDPGEIITVNVSKDVDGIYNKVKDFVKQYNELLKELNDIYGADSAKGYEPLTDDEKEAMTDDQVEKWETKIKDSLLRRDDTLGTLINSMRSALQTTVSVNDSSYSLSMFGITTSSNYSEGGLLHIYGDSEDSYGSDFDDKLKKALTEDADTVMKTLSGVASNLYSTLQEKMKTSTISSALTFYNDKQMTKQMTSYKSELSTLESRLQDIEDRYYSQFSAMETSMSKLQSQQNSLASYLG